MQIDCSRARANGLDFRPLALTAKDTLEWRLSSAVPAALREQPRYNMTDEDERKMLEAWKSRRG